MGAAVTTVTVAPPPATLKRHSWRRRIWQRSRPSCGRWHGCELLYVSVPRTVCWQQPVVISWLSAAALSRRQSSPIDISVLPPAARPTNNLGIPAQNTVTAPQKPIPESCSVQRSVDGTGTGTKHWSSDDVRLYVVCLHVIC